MTHPFSGKRVAQCWYSASDYKEIKAGMKDGNDLPALHSEWLAGAEQREEQIRSYGGTPVRIAFDMAEFQSFCAHFGVPLDTKARQHFAAVKSQMDADAASKPADGMH